MDPGRGGGDASKRLLRGTAHARPPGPLLEGRLQVLEGCSPLLLVLRLLLLGLLFLADLRLKAVRLVDGLDLRAAEEES